MRSMVASTSAGGSGEPASKKLRATRTVQKEEKQILSGLTKLFDDEEEVEYKFICDQLSGPKRVHVSRIARMLRNGVQVELDEEEDEGGSSG